ncbi:adaptor protein MecA [Salimicrobium halophilum]|uniref:Adapter protein MecA n=1 Tax=Salimicrobium halophilum TaxID=86666 RepID=A0A1G8TVV7_9BACI|nr:adaptor protein MecA [Salimicrobium halophilum]SDJ44860.1 adapter protein MecA 1/2 [Salimicrobium halophilum]
MEIERINENTVKFYITYNDVEKRGFNREEIWYDRERSEQLFWEMMDEVSDQEDFSPEGPLWIQVQAMDKGMEIIVTKAQLSQDGQKLELPDNEDKNIDIPMDEKLESLLESEPADTAKNDTEEKEEEEEEGSEEPLAFALRFPDIEDVIQLSHYVTLPSTVHDSLYHYEDAYYVYIQFTDENMNDRDQENYLSRLMEFGSETTNTIHLISEYGKTIFEEDALQSIAKHFSA